MPSNRWHRGQVLALACWVAYPAATGLASPTFTNVIEGSGLDDFTATYDFPLSGAGIAVIDMDGDGGLDLVLTGATDSTAKLYRHVGGFEWVLDPDDSSGLGKFVGELRGVHPADYDNDGDSDLFISNTEENTSCMLLRNDGGYFTEVTIESGIKHEGSTVSAAWGDYDNDGDLDLYSVRYWAAQSILYRNQGDGTFVPANFEAGLPDPEAPGGPYTFQAIWMDWDFDGDLDFYESNDRCYLGLPKNRLWLNDGEGAFVESGAEYGMDHCIDSMGVAVADYDRNGILDYYITNTWYGHVLAHRDCSGAVDVAADAGAGGYLWGWGTAMPDLDNDGYPEIYAAHMNISGYPGDNSVFHNLTDGTFADVSVSSGGTTGDNDSGVVVQADFDKDGDIDLLVGQQNLPYSLLRNDTVGVGHYVGVRLQGTESNRDGIGAWVEVYAGGERLVGNRHESTTLSGTNEPVVRFGLGETDLVTAIVVYWPSGITQLVEGPFIDEIVEVIEAAGEATDGGVPLPDTPYTERCGDDVDNDCDGETDESFGDAGDACELWVEDCLYAGVWTCSALGLDMACVVADGAEPVECENASEDTDIGAPDTGEPDTAEPDTAEPDVTDTGGEEPDDVGPDISDADESDGVPPLPDTDPRVDTPEDSEPGGEDASTPSADASGLGPDAAGPADAIGRVDTAEGAGSPSGAGEAPTDDDTSLTDEPGSGDSGCSASPRGGARGPFWLALLVVVFAVRRR